MPKGKTDAPFAFEGLDRVFHERARLGIVSSLAAHTNGLTFSELKTLCALTDGNLNRHLEVLDEAGYVTIEKGFEGKRPQTRFRLSSNGRTRFADYLGVLEQVVRRANRASARPQTSARGLAPRGG
jgi:DNA-binding transcriptional ArsR family regulator